MLNPAATPMLNTVNEDAGAPVGVGRHAGLEPWWISSAAAVSTTSPRPTARRHGIGLTGADMTNGTWHFSTNGGANWSRSP